VEISLVEAVNNVIEHGYEGKPAATWAWRCRFSPTAS
jgi:anti-sigma regulatory factor (Ser/Thr protein kinase)